MAVHSLENEDRFAHLAKRHPCLGATAHGQHGRIHLPVSPACNMQCRFCRRGFNKWERRPGVARALLAPEQAAEAVRKGLALCPELSVVGIAGPGDALATDHAIETFRLIHAEFPQLIMCLSTNGLLLREKADRLLEAGVQTVTVTVNAVDPKILSQICSHIVYEGRLMTGECAARWLIPEQLSGIEKAVRLGAVVKINTVLVPGINDRHIGEVAQATGKAGASLINIIPLIPQNEFAGFSPPTCQELNQARQSAEKHLPVFRHCQQCRADACGIPGSKVDWSDKIYDFPVPPTFSHG